VSTHKVSKLLLISYPDKKITFERRERPNYSDLLREYKILVGLSTELSRLCSIDMVTTVNSDPSTRVQPR
jgi:hypothetical protein